MIRFLKKKIVNSILLIVVSFLVFSSVAKAYIEEPDPSIPGSVSLALRDSVTKVVITGGSVVLHKVADTVKDPITGDWEYVITPEFAGAGVTIGEMPDKELAEQLSKYAADSSITGLKEDVDVNGEVSFGSLSLGLYLLVQVSPSNGYELFVPFFVSVPLYQDDHCIYDVDATPKMSPMVMNFSTPVPPPLNTPAPPSIDTPPTPTPVTGGGGPRLPQTGQLNWPIPLLAITGMLLFFAGWYLFTTGEKQKDE